MGSKKIKLHEAAKNLDAALSQYKADNTELNFLTVVKTFEVIIEYAWRELKYRIEDEGLEAPSPKMAIKQAAKLELITEPEKWIDCINARNNSVHDYFGISEDEYIELSEQLMVLFRKSFL